MRDRYLLANFNFARPREKLDGSGMRGFVENHVLVNEAATRATGYVWSFPNPDGPDTAVPGFEHEYLVINMSLWESIDSLKNYVYKSVHGRFFKKRKEWFEAPEGPNYVLWWVHKDHRPDTLEARDRLEHLCIQGPTPYAFNFTQTFPPE